MPGYKVRVIQDLIDISNKTGSGFFATRGRVASTGRTLVTTNEDGTRGMIVVSVKVATNAKARRYIPFRYAIHFTEGGPWGLVRTLAWSWQFVPLSPRGHNVHSTDRRERVRPGCLIQQLRCHERTYVASR